MSYNEFSALCLIIGWLVGLFTGIYSKGALMTTLSWVLIWCFMFSMKLLLVDA